MAAPAPAPPSREVTLVDLITGALINGPTRITSPDAPDLILDPASQTWYSSATTLRALLPHCSRALKPGDWQKLSPADSSPPRARRGAAGRACSGATRSFAPRANCCPRWNAARAANSRAIRRANASSPSISASAPSC
ncbi:hypothetical protein PEC18_19345 [Paucibacter sp. O1-1]|nr:hypothetical protein [Paucibacter sp. O1-1]MDA3827943.1 hypothetical protein [Paucibacter sp. O1-1]